MHIWSLANIYIGTRYICFPFLFVCFCASCMLHICKWVQFDANVCSVAHQCSPQWGESPSTLCSKVNPDLWHKGWSGLVPMVGLIICMVLGYCALIYSVKNACKNYFLVQEKLILWSESTKLHVLHCQVCTNYTGSAQSYMLGMCVVWDNKFLR